MVQSSRNQTITRRLAVAGAAAVAASAIGDPAGAQGADAAASVAAAVEQFRVAVRDGDAATLDRLTHAQLTYGHSSGTKIQTKAEFIADLAGKTNYETLTFTDQTVAIAGANALVRHVWTGADILPDNKVGRSYIAVLQVWLETGGRWTLLARQSCPLKAA